MTKLSGFSRKVLDTKDGQPFIIGGSGTLGWDQVRATWSQRCHYREIESFLTSFSIGCRESRGAGPRCTCPSHRILR